MPLLAPPILWRELLLPEKRKHLWALQVAYVVVLSFIFTLVWPRGGRVSVEVMQESAGAFLTWLLWVQAGLLCLAGPPLVAASLTMEREQGNLDLLLLSPMGAGRIVSTKCATQLLSLLLILFSGVPLFMLGMFMGGMSLGDVCWALAILTGLALLSCCAGAVSGAFFSSTLVAMLGGYVVLGLTVGLVPLALSTVWSPAWYLLSPFGIVSAVMGSGEGPDWGRVGPFLHVGTWLALSYFLLAAAGNRLAQGTARERSRKVGPAVPREDWEWQELPARPDRLLVWREIRGKRPSCTRLPLVLLLVLFGSVALLNALLWGDLRDPASNFAATLALCVAVLALTLFASTAGMVNERRKGDLDLLALSQLGGGRIVRGKFYGILMVVSPVLLLPIIQAALGPLPWSIFSVVLAGLILHAMVPATILSGIESGMRHDDFRKALGRCLRRWPLLLLVISAKFLVTILIPCLLVFPFLVLAFLTLVPVFVIFRYANDYMMGPIVDDCLGKQLSEWGVDTEWHGEEWEIGKIEITLAAISWSVVGAWVAFSSGQLIGVFALFLLGTGAALAALFGAVWAVQTWQKRTRAPEPIDWESC